MINETSNPIDFTDCKGVGAFLSGGECACGPFSDFDDNQECQCLDGHMRFGNKACIMCAGVGANLNEAGVCTCAEHSVLRPGFQKILKWCLFIADFEFIFENLSKIQQRNKSAKL